MGGHAASLLQSSIGLVVAIAVAFGGDARAQEPAQVPVSEALLALAKSHGKSLLIVLDTPGLEKPVPATVTDLSWDAGLAACLGASGLAVSRESGAIQRIVPGARAPVDGGSADESAGATNEDPAEAEKLTAEFRAEPIRAILRNLISEQFGIGDLPQLVIAAEAGELDQEVTLRLHEAELADAVSALLAASGLTQLRQGEFVIALDRAAAERVAQLESAAPMSIAVEADAARASLMFTDAPFLDVARTICRFCSIELVILDGESSRRVSAKPGEEDEEFEEWNSERISREMGSEPAPALLPGIPPGAMTRLTFNCRNQPWSDALLAVVKCAGLRASYDGKVVRVEAPPVPAEPGERK